MTDEDRYDDAIYVHVGPHRGKKSRLKTTVHQHGRVTFVVLAFPDGSRDEVPRGAVANHSASARGAWELRRSRTTEEPSCATDTD